jgi:hypothetical protein
MEMGRNTVDWYMRAAKIEDMEKEGTLSVSRNQGVVEVKYPTADGIVVLCDDLNVFPSEGLIAQILLVAG